MSIERKPFVCQGLGTLRHLREECFGSATRQPPGKNPSGCNWLKSFERSPRRPPLLLCSPFGELRSTRRRTPRDDKTAGSTSFRAGRGIFSKTNSQAAKDPLLLCDSSFAAALLRRTEAPFSVSREAVAERAARVISHRPLNLRQYNLCLPSMRSACPCRERCMRRASRAARDGPSSPCLCRALIAGSAGNDELPESSG